MITGSLFNSIKKSLDEYFEKLSNAWKEQETQEEFKPIKPVIYLFTVPKTEMDDGGYPLKSPAITIVLEGYSFIGNDDVELRVAFHICVVNSSIVDREISVNKGGVITFLDTDSYTDSGVDVNLYKDALTLGEITANAINYLDGKVCIVKDINMFPPDPNLPEFPFSTCKIECKISMLQTRKGAPLYESYYDLL